MLKRNLWKLIVSFAIVAWALSNMVPVKDQEFTTFIREQAGAKQAEFGKLLDEAITLKKEGKASSEFIALKRIAKERRIDLTTYFPEIELESTLRNVEKRNDILLNEVLRRAQGRMQLGLDLKGGISVTLEVDETAAASQGSHEDRSEKLTKAIEIISQRINAFGVAEPIIRPVGNNRIEIQLPGISTKDNPEVVEAVKKPARLDFRSVHPTLTPGPGVETPIGYEIMTLDHESAKTGEIFSEEIFVKRRPEMTGEGIDRSYARPDLYGKPEIIMLFTKEGRDRFAIVTGDIASAGQQSGRVGRLAIVLDGKLYSAPSVREKIDSESAQISGSFTDREAISLANVLNNPLDLPLVVKEQYEVGPTLAVDAVMSARTAFIISTCLTIGFMLFFYTIGGVIAAIGMGVNVLVTLGTMAYFGATLSMPGIGGIVLTLAMSVDSNILIFERMREELAMGKNLVTALELGFEKAWSAIIDSNVTTLFVGVIMIVLGKGPVQGFGVTLTIGIFTTMFAAVVVSKLLLEAIIVPGLIPKLPMFRVLQNTNFDFMGKAKMAFIVSFAIVGIGVGAIIYKGKDVYGIDFAGGDTITLSFEKKLELGTLQTSAKAAAIDANFGYQKPIGGEKEVLKVTTPFDQAKPLVAKLMATHPDAKFHVEGENRIGPAVGKEIQWNAFWAIFWSLVLIMVYVGFRFEIGYGIGAVVSTFHDLLMVIGIFVLFDRQFNASMVAAILLIAGYSINDTIVVFDRIREELHNNPDKGLKEVINNSLNLTLSRTIITGGTTFLSAITLIVVTTGEINDIAFTLLIGVITGTFSSLFIASPLFYWWHKGDRKHVEAHSDVTPVYEWDGSSNASK